MIWEGIKEKNGKYVQPVTIINLQTTGWLRTNEAYLYHNYMFIAY